MSPVTITEQGRKALGRALLNYRTEQGLSLDKAVEIINARSGHRFSKSTIGDIENGATKQISLNTLLGLSQSGYGGMTYVEMVDILTDRRLAVCESGAKYSA
jgi:transcriptional regulator with XRE-family HTH domain